MLPAIRFTTFLTCGVLAAFISLVVTEAPQARSISTSAVERRIHIDPPGPNESRYVYIPFDVPPHTVRVRVSYQYDRVNGTNTIDIGLFDARSTGSDTDPRGFRGWSGGRRSEFFVSRDQATPGYLPGEIRAGTWRIILGLYRVAPAGVDVSFKIDIETEQNKSPVPIPSARETNPTGAAVTTLAASRPPQFPSLEQKVAGNGLLWWRGDLHLHTVHSDGDWTIAELISSARTNGLDFIVVTDHNTASHHADIDRLRKGSRRPLVLRGEEITTYGGHTNAWGLPSGTWIDFRVRPGDSSRISSMAGKVHRAGALISINHPFALCGGCAWSYDPAARDFDAIEVWNGPWDFTDEPAIKMWDQILQSGRRITAVASTDSHRPDTPIGEPATHVAMKALSQAALLTAIRQGHAYLTNGTPRLAISFEAEPTTGKRRRRAIIGDEIHLPAPGKLRFFTETEGAAANTIISLISDGQVVRAFPARSDAQPQVIEIDCRHDSYFRLELRDEEKTMLALTNPIYVRLTSQ